MSDLKDVNDFRDARPSRTVPAGPESPGHAGGHEGGPEERRLQARTEELDLIQGLAHSASEAMTPRQLIASTVAVLCRGDRLDLVAVAHALDGEPTLASFESRPFSATFLAALERRAARLLGDADGTAPLVTETVRLDVFDAAQGTRDDFDEQQLTVLPLRRRNAPVAWMLAVPAPAVDDAELRLLYAGANQISLHLDRILTAGEAEAGRFRAILESMPQAVFLADERLNVLQANAAARQLIEESGPDPVSWLGLEEGARSVLDGRRRLASEEVRIASDRVFSVTLSPFDSGDRAALVVVITDVSERRRMQEQLAQSEKMSSLGQMISGVTHELNNPLATILGYTQMMASSVEDEQVARRIRILHDEAQRCRKIVENLLSFARQRGPERAAASLNEIVGSIVTLLRYQLKVDHVRLEADLGEDVPSVHGDAHLLRQVVVNLVTNARQAVKSVSGASRDGVVRLSTRRDAGGGALLIVEDSGPGVPDDIRSKIFDPFFTTKAEGEGTGLGLSLVYGIVADHGGTIEVGRSNAGGAAFRLLLPAG